MAKKPTSGKMPAGKPVKNVSGKSDLKKGGKSK